MTKTLTRRVEIITDTGDTLEAHLLDSIGALDGVWVLALGGQDYHVSRSFLNALGTVVDIYDETV